MNEIELKYADFCIEKLKKSYPSPSNIEWIDEITMCPYDEFPEKNMDKILGILVFEGLIEKIKNMRMHYRLKENAFGILKNHNSYSDYYLFNEKQNKQIKERETIEFELAKSNIEANRLNAENAEQNSKDRRINLIFFIINGIFAAINAIAAIIQLWKSGD